jgi:hypothetical protein
MSVKCGVPQGSILGPLLFILFINDIINTSKLIEFIMFADDTNLFFKHTNLKTLYEFVNNELVKISKWFKLNKLSLNIKKKKNYIIFRNKNKKITNQNLSLKIDDTVIEQVHNTKFLGVIINQNLTWHDHINTVCTKVSKSIGILLRIRNSVPSNILITLYHTLILPYFNYCNIVWGSQNATALDKLFRKQKKAIRIVTKAKWNAHTGPIFRNHYLLTLFNINKLQIYCFMYKVTNNLLPSYFQNFFVPNSNIHSHYTKQTTKMHKLSCNTQLRAFSIRFYGSRLWNSLSDEIINSKAFCVFKARCRKHLVDNC